MKNLTLKKHDTLVIVGGYTDTRKLFDFDRQDCDILLFNEAPFSVPWATRCDICIQVHDPVIWRNPTNPNDPKHYERLQANTTIPVLMQEEYPDVPMSVKFPLDEIKAKYGDFLLSSSAAESIAWGLYMGYKRIEMYGVEMATNTEYATQRPGVTYWIGMARGILGKENVHFANNTFSNVIYGFDGDVRLSEEYFTARLGELEGQLKAVTEEYKEKSKASSELVENYGATGEGADLIPDAVKQLAEAGYKLGVIDGKKQVIEASLKRIQTSKDATEDYITNRQMYERETAMTRRKSDEFAAKAQQLALQAHKAYQFTLGANGNKGKRQYRLKAFVKAVVLYKNASSLAGGYRGASEENQDLMIRLSEMVNAAGGMKSLDVLTKVGQA